MVSLGARLGHVGGAGAGVVVGRLHLEGLGEAEPGVVAGDERVLDEEDLENVARCARQ